MEDPPTLPRKLRIYNGAHCLQLQIGATKADPTPPEQAAGWLKAPSQTTLHVAHPTEKAQLAYFNALCKHFTYVEAAGGVVVNEVGNLLVFFRRGMWDLPKGKIDPGETPETAALREIQEETGLQQLSLGGHLHRTFHVYAFKDRWWLKQTYWYAVKGTAAEALIPQTEEDIVAIEWVSLAEAQARETYQTIRDVLAAYASRS